MLVTDIAAGITAHLDAIRAALAPDDYKDGQHPLADADGNARYEVIADDRARPKQGIDLIGVELVSATIDEEYIGGGGSWTVAVSVGLVTYSDARRDALVAAIVGPGGYARNPANRPAMADRLEVVTTTDNLDADTAEKRKYQSIISLELDTDGDPR